MRGRDLLMAACDPPPPPTDLERLNAYAAAYNAYVAALQRGELAIKLWAEAERLRARLR